MLKTKSQKLNKLYIYQAFWLVLIAAAIWGLVSVRPDVAEDKNWVQTDTTYSMSGPALP